MKTSSWALLVTFSLVCRFGLWVLGPNARKLMLSGRMKIPCMLRLASPLVTIRSGVSIWLKPLHSPSMQVLIPAAS